MLELAPGILLREHAPQIGDVGLRSLRRQFATGYLFRFVELALQADDQRQVLANAAVGARLADRRPQIVLRRLEVAA